MSATTTRPIRVASICHNEAEASQPGHRRVRLEMRWDSEAACYRWYGDGDPTDVTGETVYDAEIAAATAWQYEGWDIKATWLC